MNILYNGILIYYMSIGNGKYLYFTDHTRIGKEHESKEDAFQEFMNYKG